MKEIKILAVCLCLATALLFFQRPAIAADGDDGSASSAAKFEDWKVVGPSGGDVRVIAVDPRNKDRLYVSTLDGQIYTSPDAGKSWTLLVNFNKPQLVLDQLFVDSRDSNKIYASGHRHTAAGGFWRSVDGGLTWKESKELRDESIHAMTQSTFDPNVLVVGTIRGIWVSRDSGESWEQVESPTMPVNIDSLAIDPRNTSTIYAGTWWRPYKSTDTGKSWRLIKDGMIDDSDVFAIDIDPANAEHVVASACSGIYESGNGGEKWAKIQGIPSQSRRTRDLFVNPSIPGAIYAATTEGFWMTANGGKSWALTTSRDLEVNSIAVNPDAPNRIFIGTNNYGVMVSNDGGRNFEAANGNFTSRFAYSIVADTQTPDRLYAMTQNTATGGGFFFLSTDRGATWKAARNLDSIHVVPFTLLQDSKNPNLLYIGTNVGLYRSIDRGVNWTPVVGAKVPAKKGARRPGKPAAKAPVKRGSAVTARNPSAAATESGPVAKFVPTLTQSVRVLAFTTDGKNGMFAGTEQGLFRTYDLSKGWEQISLGPDIDQNIFAVHTAADRPGTIWVGTARSGLLVSHDDGKTWDKVGGASEGVPVGVIVSDPKRPDYLYVGTAQTLYLSHDGGQTWTRRGGNLPLGNFTSIVINPDNTDEILVSSAAEVDGGVFQSTDAGNKWKRIDNKDMKIASRRVWKLTMDPNDRNRIYAGTQSSGVYIIEREARSAASTASPPSTPTTTSN